jgi:branched-chain amino acid transport system substrate-binding protein
MSRISLLPRLFALTALIGLSAHAADPIRIGEVNSYKSQPAFLEPYRKAMMLAVDEINAAGGVNGRPLELVIRDDNGTPGDAVRAAEELVSREHVVMLAGEFLSNVGLAVSDFARQRKVPFLASEPLTDKITWANGNRYTFRLRPSTWMQVSMLIPEAVKLNKKRWAIVYPNYEYGQSAAETFKTLLKAAQPDVEFVADQATPLGKLDAGPVVQALSDSKPDAIFNVLFATDLTKFVREATTRGLFKGREVVSLLSGEPEYLDPLGADAPSGWIVTGYPWYSIKTPEHDAFLQAYRKKYGEPPRQGSVVGYSTIYSIAAALKRANSVDPEKIVDAFHDLPVKTPWGAIVFRAQDNQSTLGAFVGRTAVKGSGADRSGIMVDYHYADGAKYQPSDAEVRKLRPAN